MEVSNVIKRLKKIFERMKLQKEIGEQFMLNVGLFKCGNKQHDLTGVEIFVNSAYWHFYELEKTAFWWYRKAFRFRHAEDILTIVYLHNKLFPEVEAG